MVEGQHTPGPTEGKIGPVLERARKDKGLSLEEAERATKIRKRYLDGLERDDYSVLPDAVYARGFLKTYANFLGLDGDGLSEELRTRKKPRRERRLSYAAPRSDFERPIISPGGVPGAEKRNISSSTIVTVVIAALVIAALVGALYYVGLSVRSSGVDDAQNAEGIAAPAEPQPGGSGEGSRSGPITAAMTSPSASSTASWADGLPTHTARSISAAAWATARSGTRSVGL